MQTNHKTSNEILILLYEQFPALLAGLFTSTTAIFVYFKIFQETEANAFTLHLWYATFLVLILLRYFLYKAFQKEKPHLKKTTPWKWLFSLGVVFSGVLTGITPIIFLSDVNSVDTIFLSIIIFGTISGSLAALSSHLASYYLYTILTISPLSYLLFQTGEQFTIIAFTLIIFSLAHMFYARNIFKLNMASIEQRFENDSLIFQLKEQTKTAEKANLDKSRFLAATSHDLRQPLHSLSLFLEVLQTTLSNQKQKELMKKTKLSQEALVQQLNAIIELTQIDAGHVPVNNQKLDLKPFITNICDEFQLSARKSGCLIEYKIEDDTVDTDPLILSRITRNLISNAIQHCPNCRISIYTKTSSKTKQLIFKDNGPGIPLDKQKHIFSEFYQLNNPERDRNKGVGLGLSIVKRFTQLLDMPITLKSEPGAGSEFMLTLNNIVINDELNTPRTTTTEPLKVIDTELTGINVTLIEDDDAIRDAMTQTLTLWNCNLLSFKDSEEAMQIHKKTSTPKPDLIISDYRLLNNHNGLVAIQTLRKHYKKTIPAILISGDTTEQLKKSAKNHNIIVLYKPVQSQALKNSIITTLQS